MATPNIDAAIRAGCTHERRTAMLTPKVPCGGAECGCEEAKNIRAALYAAYQTIELAEKIISNGLRDAERRGTPHWMAAPGEREPAIDISVANLRAVLEMVVAQATRRVG